MKKTLLLAVISTSVVGMMQSCKKDTPTGASSATLNVVKKQRSLLIYNASTFSQDCGASSNAEFSKAIAANSTDNLIALNLQPITNPYLSPLTPIYYNSVKDSLVIAPFNTQLYSQTKPTGTLPQFYLSNSSLGNVTVSAADIANYTAQYNSSATVEIGVAANASLSGNKFTVNYKMQAFEPEAGAQYYTTVLLVEKGISSFQVGATNNKMDQKNIIRASMQYDANNFQTAFAVSDIKSNKDSTLNKTVTFDYVPVSQKWITAVNANYQTLTGNDFGWWTLNKSNTAAVVVVWKYISPTELFYINSVWADVK